MAEIPTEGRGDPRIEFLQEYTIKTLRLKPDKWSRMVVSDEQRTFVANFIDRAAPQVSLTMQITLGVIGLLKCAVRHH